MTPETFPFQEILLAAIPFLLGWALPSIRVTLELWKVGKYSRLIAQVLLAIDPILASNIDKWGEFEVYDEIKAIARRLAGSPLTDDEVEFVLEQVIKKFNPGKMLRTLRSQGA